MAGHSSSSRLSFREDLGFMIGSGSRIHGLGFQRSWTVGLWGFGNLRLWGSGVEVGALRWSFELLGLYWDNGK